MKVAITDYAYEHVDAERKIISAIPAELVTGQCRTEDEVIELARDADALICQFAPISCRVIKELSKCRVIVRYAIGVDVIDVKCAEEEGIHVCNVPDYGVDEVSDHAMLLLLAAARKLPDL
jgi:D-3-phosphoglycerate dehydrogenase / 2-oxoglutarate reductase